ncbi:sensor histidine kinase [Piscibacillus salipiscarius]|uniref:Sensor histidine kinase n=2 Tax=Piscibacillus salipiscarius TaxID=299480 RepID=A0ABW5QDP0_9BACI
MIILFTSLHIQELMKSFSINLSYFITTLVIVVIVALVSRKFNLETKEGPILWRVILGCIQLVILFINFISETVWGSLSLFIIFIGLEWFRHIIIKQFKDTHNKIIEYERERENLNNTFRTVRSERHDYLKHISAIHFLLESHKHEEAKFYLDQLVDSYEETNLSIKGETGVVAASLHQSYKRAKELGISVDYSLDVPISSLPMSDRDIVSLVGNLLSNGIDACEHWQIEKGKQALITLDFYKRSGLYILTCENDSVTIPAKILDRLYIDYGVTTKGETHEGLGTKIIKDIVKKYDGFLDFVHKDEKFLVKIKIPLIK